VPESLIVRVAEALRDEHSRQSN